MRPPKSLLLVAAVLGLAAFTGVLDVTDPPGPGLDPDSMSYLGAAVSLAHGDGLRVPSSGWESDDVTSPLAHFPPGFPVTIAAGVAAGMPPANAARLVEAAAAFATVAVTVIAAYAAAGWIAAIAAVAMLAATPALTTVHCSVLSEPLFLALLVLFTWQLSRDGDAHPRRRMLVLGTLAAVATLVRYAGASLAGAAMLDAFVSTGNGGMAPLTRLRRAAAAGVIPVAAFGAWALSRPRAGGEKVRSVGLYLHGWTSTLADGADTVSRWMAPGVDTPELRAAVALFVLAVLATLAARTVRAVRHEERTAPARRLLRAVLIVGGCYLLLIGVSRLFADRGIPFDDRMLAPAFLLAILTIAPALALWWRVASLRDAVLSGALFAFWIASGVEATASSVDDYRTDGGDFAAREWRLSPLMQWAGTAGPSTRLYSNWPEAIWFHTARVAQALPTTLDPRTAAEFGAMVRRNNGAVLAFATPSPDYPQPDSVARLAGLVAVASWPSGTIWRAPADSGTTGLRPGVPRTIRP